MIYYYEIGVAVFLFLAFLIYTDPNAAPYFNLIFKESWINIRRWFYIAIMYPRIKFDMWMMKRLIEKIKKQNERS